MRRLEGRSRSDRLRPLGGFGVCARDLYRLVDGFRGTAAAHWRSTGLERLCGSSVWWATRGRGRRRRGRGGDQTRRRSVRFPAILQRAQRQGVRVQVAETCHAENATQLITHVEVTPSSGSDTDVTVPLVDGLAERKVRPEAHGVWVEPQRLRGLAPGDGTGEPGGGVGAGELTKERETDRRRSLGRTSR